MTVKQLRELLAGFADETLVVLSRDSEGNGFSPVTECSTGLYAPIYKWSGEVFQEGPLTPELIEAGYEAEDLRQVGEHDAVRCVVLWPLN